MNILDVIKQCVLSSNIPNAFSIRQSETSIYSSVKTTSSSIFSNFSSLQREMGVMSIDEKLVRIYMRVWTSFGRRVAEIVGRGACCVCSEAGNFFPVGNVCGYSPGVEIMEKYGLSLVEDSYNTQTHKLDSSIPFI